MQSAHIERPEPQKDQPALSLLVEGPSVVWPVQFIVQMHPEDPVGVHHLHPLPVYGNMSWGGFSWTTSSMIFLRLSWIWFTSNRETSAVSCPYIIFLIIVIMCREIDFFFFLWRRRPVWKGGDVYYYYINVLHLHNDWVQWQTKSSLGPWEDKQHKREPRDRRTSQPCRRGAAVIITRLPAPHSRDPQETKSSHSDTRFDYDDLHAHNIDFMYTKSLKFDNNFFHVIQTTLFITMSGCLYGVQVSVCFFLSDSTVLHISRPI